MPADMTSITNIVNLGAFVNNSLGDRVRPEVFYDKILLDTIRLTEDQYVYFRLAESKPIGDKAGKLVLRRRTPLKGHTVPLSEGIPPVSDKFGMFKYEISAQQYGRYMEFTDKVDFAMIDPVVSEYTQEYSLVAMETLDLLAREALLANCSKRYAGGVADLKAIIGTATDMKPTMTDLRLAVLDMTKNQIKPRSNGRFQVIASEDFFYDIIDDPYVKAYMELNQTTATMYDNSRLVPMFNMEFYATLCCPTTGAYMDGTTAKILQINSTTGVISSVTSADNSAGYVSANDHSGNTVSATSYMPAGAYKTATFSSSCVEYKAQHVFIVGAGALVRTGLTGEDNAKMYVKPLGSSGVLDPIDQRQSIGFKINSVGFAVLDPKAVVDYVCIPSTVNAVTPVAPVAAG